MVKLLYAADHLDCPNYDARHRPAIEEKYLPAGTTDHVQPWVNKLVFILEGGIEYSLGQTKGLHARKGHILFLPANSRLSVTALQDTHIGIARLYNKIQLCDCFRLEDLMAMGQANKHEKQAKDIHGPPFVLETNPVMERYVEVLTLCHRAGLKCRYYNEGKIREMMFILRAFYPKEDLHRFFAPALSTDTWFSQFIMSNYNKYDNLSALASAMNYTVSGFEKKFRRVFAQAPYAWMRKQRAREAYHCINTSDMTLKEIAERFGFNSQPAFTRFIQQNFGQTPSQIRKKSKKGGNE
jgi:AraC-like DNA-binding protein